MFCILFCLFFSSLACAETKKSDPVIWSYYEDGYELYAPQLSNDNKFLTLVRKRHLPDGHEAEMLSDAELKKFDDEVKKNSRFADPEITLIGIKDKSKQMIDYGWDPIFSKNQTEIFYAHQVKPISGFRMLAATMAGNEIRSYDTLKNETIARPSFGYLSQPQNGENNTVIFALSDGVNGDYGGNIGLGMVDLKTKQQKVLYEPRQEHKLYHLVNKFAGYNGSNIILRRRPLTEGVYLADAYAAELIEVPSEKILYSWGELKERQDVDFRICSNQLEVYDEKWQTLNKVESRFNPKQYGFSSPNCEYIASINEDDKQIKIYSTNGEVILDWKPQSGRILEHAWSPDSTRLVLLVSHGLDFNDKGEYEAFKFDQIVILSVDDIKIN